MSDDDTFAALFEAQSKGQKAARPVRVGDTVEGVVVHVGVDTVFVELDGKRQAMLDTAEVRDADGNVTITVGEVYRSEVVSVDPRTGDVKLGRALRGIEIGKTVRGRVTSVRDFGAFVDVGGADGLVPAAELRRRKGAAPLKAGDEVDVQIVDVKEGDRGKLRISLSLRGARPEAEPVEAPREESASRKAEKKVDQRPEKKSLGTFGDLMRRAKK